MRTRSQWVTCLLLLVAVSGAGRVAGHGDTPAAPGSFAFVDVTVVPMDRAGALPGQTVLVSDGVIAAIGHPLVNVRNLARRSGVMVRGRWFPAAELEQGLEEMARRYRPGP